MGLRKHTTALTVPAHLRAHTCSWRLCSPCPQPQWDTQTVWELERGAEACSMLHSLTRGHLQNDRGGCWIVHNRRLGRWWREGSPLHDGKGEISAANAGGEDIRLPDRLKQTPATKAILFKAKGKHRLHLWASTITSQNAHFLVQIGKGAIPRSQEQHVAGQCLASSGRAYSQWPSCEARGPRRGRLRRGECLRLDLSMWQGCSYLRCGLCA